MGVFEDMKEKDPAKRFRIGGVEDAEKIRKDFWNTVNSNKVSDNILTDSNVEVVDVDGLQVVCLHVPMAIFRIDGSATTVKGLLPRSRSKGYLGSIVKN